MAKQTINPSSGSYNHTTDPATGYDENHLIKLGNENAGNGDPLRTAFKKINTAFDKIDSNFTEIYNQPGGSPFLIDGGNSTTTF
jgi:hypothetical protein